MTEPQSGRPPSVAGYLFRFALLFLVIQGLFLAFAANSPGFAAYLRGYATVASQ